MPLQDWFRGLTPRRLIVLASLGLVSSLATVYPCSLWGDVYPDDYEAAKSANGDWYLRGWGVRPGRYECCVSWAQFAKVESDGTICLITGGWGHSCDYPLRAAPTSDDEIPVNASCRHTIFAGAPFPCLTGWHDESGGCWVETRASRGIICPHYRMFLPILPLWSGLAADTLVFGALWHIGLLTLGRNRAQRRARTGLCPQCAYDLRATPRDKPCPECGRPSSTTAITNPPKI